MPNQNLAEVARAMVVEDVESLDPDDKRSETDASEAPEPDIAVAAALGRAR